MPRIAGRFGLGAVVAVPVKHLLPVDAMMSLFPGPDYNTAVLSDLHVVALGAAQGPGVQHMVRVRWPQHPALELWTKPGHIKIVTAGPPEKFFSLTHDLHSYLRGTVPTTTTSSSSSDLLASDDQDHFNYVSDDDNFEEAADPSLDQSQQQQQQQQQGTDLTLPATSSANTSANSQGDTSSSATATTASSTLPPTSTATTSTATPSSSSSSSSSGDFCFLAMVF